ncbi:hypothetical protein O0L34_g8254 [Tuta absoluta]|nr:hypothetical protein O0L34_g8254 [Tuta absoluta]
MAKIDSKTALTDLTKAVTLLTKKISEQAVLIEAQNVKIKEHNLLIESHKKVVEDLKTTVSTLQASMCAPLPTRPESPNHQATERKCPSDEKHSSSNSTIPNPDMSERARRAASRANKHATERATSTSSAKKTPLQSSTKDMEDAVGPRKTIDLKMTTSVDKVDVNNDWQEVRCNRKKRKLKSPPIMTGTGSGMDTLQTVERLKFIQAWSFKPDTILLRIYKKFPAHPRAPRGDSPA